MSDIYEEKEEQSVNLLEGKLPKRLNKVWEEAFAEKKIIVVFLLLEQI